MLHKIKTLIARHRDACEREDLIAELREIRYLREYADIRVPRILRRLAELEEKKGGGRPLSAKEVSAFDALVDGWGEDNPSSFAERHPQLAEEACRLRALEDGEVVA